MSWEPLNLAYLQDQARPTPSRCGLVYPGGIRHVFSGPPESAKSWVGMILALEEIRAGGRVAWIDFEQGSFQTRDRLVDLAAEDSDFDGFLYVEPEVEASAGTIGDLLAYHQPTLTVIDASAGAFALHGLDDNARRDVEIFAQAMIDPFRQAGVSTVVLDHVVKSSESRGKFAIGSERKVGVADVHLGFEAEVPFGRGRTGLVVVRTHKDRYGHLPRPRAAEIELRSDPQTGRITWGFSAGAEDGDSGASWRPTALMEKVSRYLEQRPDGASRNEVEQAVSGKAKYLREAIDCLVADGYASQTPGPRGAKLLALVTPYTTSSHLVPPLRGDEDEDEVADEVAGTVNLGTSSLDELQHLADQGLL